MTPARDALLATYEAAAKAAQAAEHEVRQAMVAKVTQLERQPAFAFRRTRLIRTLAQHACNAETKPEDAWPAQRDAVRLERGWSDPSDAHERLLARLDPVAVGVRRGCLDAADEDATATAVQHELAAFEAWYGDIHRSPFYALLDQNYPEVPVVDF